MCVNFLQIQATMWQCSLRMFGSKKHLFYNQKLFETDSFTHSHIFSLLLPFYHTLTLSHSLSISHSFLSLSLSLSLSFFLTHLLTHSISLYYTHCFSLSLFPPLSLSSRISSQDKWIWIVVKLPAGFWASLSMSKIWCFFSLITPVHWSTGEKDVVRAIWK